MSKIVQAPRKKSSSASDYQGPRCLSGQALLDDMAAYGKKVTATPDSARDFLRRLGVLTKDGKRRDLISD